MDYHDSTVGIAPSSDPAATVGDASMTGSGATTHTPSFLLELARAMQVAAGHEHERIAAAVAEDATAHVERTQVRAAAETEELRRLAAEDVERIRAWSATEIERVRDEAARRTEQRRNDLDDFLRRHDEIIGIEIAGVDAAVQAYRATLQAFFDELNGSTNPADIAARAGSLPRPPDLDTVRALARSGAVARFAEDSVETTGDDMDDSASANNQPNDPGASVADSPAATSDDPGRDDDGMVGVGVMDPDAIGAAAELPGELEAAGPEADHGAEPAAEGDALGEPEVHAGTAVRLLRSIATWTEPSVSKPQDPTPPDR